MQMQQNFSRLTLTEVSCGVMDCAEIFHLPARSSPLPSPRCSWAQEPALLPSVFWLVLVSTLSLQGGLRLTESWDQRSQLLSRQPSVHNFLLPGPSNLSLPPFGPGVVWPWYTALFLWFLHTLSTLLQTVPLLNPP